MANKQFARVGADLRPEAPPQAVRRRGARTRAATRGTLSPARRAGASRKILALTWLGMAFLMLYAVTIGLALVQPDYSWLDRIGAGALLFGLGFIIIHSVGYANSTIKADWNYRAARPPLFASFGAPRVACIIASFNEPPDVLEETITAVLALDYAHKDVIVLDDSTKEASREAARLLCARYGVQCVQRTNRRGYKAGAINDYLPFVAAPYIAIFDADALPTASFLRECVPQLHENPKLAFLQTPQFYANTEVSYVALASARQQNVFYESICEGKSVSQAAFCCGTNVIFRRAALESIGGFDELNVTEDFATSFFLHFKGWDTLYVNRVYVYSLAPENLAAYFTQQSRWSFGTLGTARSFIKAFRQNPRALRAGQWWEYFLSATYYWVGWVNFIFLCLPLTYLFFGVKPLRQDVFTYLLVFVPYMFFTLHMFYSGMERRGYKLSEMVLGQQIGFISFPIHMSSAVSGLMGKKRPFGVTPKGVGGHIAWISLWPQLLMLGLSALAFGLGVYRYFAGLDRNSTAVIINSLWALYHVWMLSSVFQLNRDVREGAEKSFFGDAAQKRRAAPLPALEGAKNPLSLRRIGGTLGLASLAGLGLAGYAAWQVLAWSRAPVVPVNVYLVDRTPTRDGNQHRAVLWMLNYLKIAKSPDFGPSRSARRNYDADLDFYGAMASASTKPQIASNGDATITNFDRALPTRLSLPGALYLADTYGETAEFDAQLGQNVRRRNARRGLSVGEIDAIETFARRGGLVMAEWNSLGFPTRPGGFIAPSLLNQAIASLRARSARLGREIIPQAREAVAREAASGSFARLGIARGRLEDARGALVDATYKLRGLQGALLSSQVNARQDAAATRLEKLLRTAPSGWYGRYVEDFAAEKIYNPALWQAARADLQARGAPLSELRGPGFVFYPGIPDRVFDPQTGVLSPARLPRPIAVVGTEMKIEPGTHSGENSGLEAALIEKATSADLADDPLLRGMGDRIPARNWFEVTLPQDGARVLASYRLAMAPAAISRLKKRGFPAQYLASDGQSLRFPALVVGRDGNSARGELRSVYIAGDAAGYAAVPAAARRLPALGRLDEGLATHWGSFPARFTWDFYAPVLRQALTATPRLRSGRALAGGAVEKP